MRVRVVTARLVWAGSLNVTDSRAAEALALAHVGRRKLLCEPALDRLGSGNWTRRGLADKE